MDRVITRASCSCSPLRDDAQPTTDAIPVPAALLLPDAIKGPYGFLLKTVKHTLLLLDRYDLKLRQSGVI